MEVLSAYILGSDIIYVQKIHNVHGLFFLYLWVSVKRILHLQVRHV